MESGVDTFSQPHHPFAYIYVDIVGPLHTSYGYRYLFTVIDRSNCWPEALPIQTAASALSASALLSGWVVRFANLEHISSEKSTTFTSQLWTSLVNLVAITLHQTTAYNPADNEIVECSHCTIKAALMSHCNDSNWFTQLPWVLLGLGTTPMDALNVSTAEMVYGNPLVIPAEFFLSAASSDNLQCLRHFVGKFTPCLQTYKLPALKRTKRFKHHNTCVHANSHYQATINASSDGPLPCFLN
ncbi:uncharacterized protein [Palaemon carinicauda]|uniref:uncharacterized protein n=1 Tax=Palaemon carinicauda TaxID=392227 RepID=UPI0035B6530B